MQTKSLEMERFNTASLARWEMEIIRVNHSTHDLQIQIQTQTTPEIQPFFMEASVIVWSVLFDSDLPCSATTWNFSTYCSSFWFAETLREGPTCE